MPPLGKNDALKDPIAPGNAKCMASSTGRRAGQSRFICAGRSQNEDQSLRKEHHHAGSRDGRQASDGDHSGRQPPDAAPCLLTKIDRERDQHCLVLH